MSDRGAPTKQNLSGNAFEGLDRYLVQFATVADDLLRIAPLGIDLEFVTGEIQQLRGIVGRMEGSEGDRDSSLDALRALTRSPWNCGAAAENLQQSVAHAAGALLTSTMWVDRTDPHELRRSLIAKTLYQHLAELLDDVIDSGDFSRAAAGKLYRRVLAPLTRPTIEPEALRRGLRGLDHGAGPGLAEPLIRLTVELHRELGEAPRAGEFRELFAIGNRLIGVGQSLSVGLQGRRTEISSVRRVAQRQYAPSAEINWVERLARSMSHVSNLALLDLYFARPTAAIGDLNEHLRAWYYLDAVIALMDHLADLRTDAEEGIANLALLQMRPTGPAPGRGPREMCESLANEDFDYLLGRLAALSARALAHGRLSGVAPERSYRLLLFLIPVVMLPGGKDHNRALLPRYLQRLSASLERGTATDEQRQGRCDSATGEESYQATWYSQHAAPSRTHDVFTTEPVTPRAAMIPS